MWETRVFHGQVNPVCEIESSLITICGLCFRSGAWNYEKMKISDASIRRLISESHCSAASPLQVPIDVYARHPLLEDELLSEGASSPVKTKDRGREVQVWTGSPKRMHRASQHRICGGKFVEMS